MHKVPGSTPPPNFHVTVAGPDASGVLPYQQVSPPEPGRDRPSPLSRGRWQLPRHSTYGDRASVWWDSWIPVAATGWGALVLIAPVLVLADVLAWASGHRSWRRCRG